MESTDFSDGSHQTLVVEQTSSNTFSVVYIDEKASICGVDTQGAPLFETRGEGEGTSDSHLLSVNLIFRCMGDTEWFTDAFPIVFEYNHITGSLTDTFSNSWTRP